MTGDSTYEQEVDFEIYFTLSDSTYHVFIRSDTNLDPCTCHSYQQQIRLYAVANEGQGHLKYDAFIERDLTSCFCQHWYRTCSSVILHVFI